MALKITPLIFKEMVDNRKPLQDCPQYLQDAFELFLFSNDATTDLFVNMGNNVYYLREDYLEIFEASL